MTLEDWFTATKTKKGDFANRIGVSAGRISQLIGGAPASIKVARKIEEATGGQVKAITVCPDLASFVEASAAE